MDVLVFVALGSIGALIALWLFGEERWWRHITFCVVWCAAVAAVHQLLT